MSNSMAYFKSKMHDILPYKITDGEVIEMATEEMLHIIGHYEYDDKIKFSDDSGFEHIAIFSFAHDGTALFTLETMARVLYDVYEIMRNDVNIIIGNTILIREYGNFGTEDKPWLHQRDTVAIPYKINKRSEIND